MSRDAPHSGPSSGFVPEPGSLYLVATPIGNLGDVTLRALDVLRGADVVLAEDTRRTRNLLARFAIGARLRSFHEHNEGQRRDEVLARLAAGDAVALVSDAGTPLINDPGYDLVRAAVQAGHPVVPIPGPSAVLSALTASGLPSHRFLFAGYPPRGAGARRRFLQGLAAEVGTLVLLESPRRLARLLGDAAELLGPRRRVVVAREITKAHEEFLRGTLGGIEVDRHLRGEVTVCIEGAPEADTTPAGEERLKLDLEGHYRALVDRGLGRKEALRLLVEERGISRNAAYEALFVDDDASPDGPDPAANPDSDPRRAGGSGRAPDTDNRPEENRS